MHSETGGKSYFLKRSGRITGPFPMLKLTALFRNGDLSCQDMYSADKQNWQYMDTLFPALKPEQPIAVQPPEPQPPAEEKVSQTADETEKNNRTDECMPLHPSVRRVSDPSAAMPLLRLSKEPPLKEWSFDIARTFALLWNFQEILLLHSKKSSRYYGIASLLHVFLGVVIILLLGKYYSTRFHYFFSPLMGLSLIALLWGIASLIGWLTAKYCTPAKQKALPSWKLCAAGLFMDYGTIACCVLALAHGLQNIWVMLLLVFINSLIMCSSAMQLRDYLEAEGKNWKAFVLVAVVLLNPAIAAIICCFIKLI